DACTGAGTCYVLVSGTCRNAKVQDKDVYLSAATVGATIDPTSLPPAAGPAVLVQDMTKPTTATLTGLTIQGAFGTSPGVNCTQVTNPVTCNLYGDTVQNNAGTGVSA